MERDTVRSLPMYITMRQLRDVIRGRGEERQEPEITEASLPLLPIDRRPITPDPTQNGIDQLANLGIFGRLPPELRWRILTLVFGNRMLHLDLRYMPIRRRDRSLDNSHDRGRPPYSYKHSIVLPGLPNPYNEECAWQWYGGVCHSQLPEFRPLAQNIRSSKRSPYSWPYADVCLQGRISACKKWRISHRGQDGHCDARIGAMGWLLACRQAYMEGTAVLYGSNSFRIESRELLDALLDPDTSQRVIPPQHLAMVNSLEIILRVNLFGKLQHIKRAIPTTLPNLEGLVRAFPNLTALVISFPDDLYYDKKIRPSARIPEIKDVLLDPLSRAFILFPPEQRKRFIVELAENVFRELILSHQFTKQAVGSQQSQNWGTWLTYPITNYKEWQHLVEDIVPHAEEARVDNVPLTSSYKQDGSYYYIKQGEQSNLVWSDNGESFHRGQQDIIT